MKTGNNTMSTWIIEPHDPLIFRDGKPFGRTPGVQAKSLPFPFPSTTAGGARSQAASEMGVFTLDPKQDEQQLKQLKSLRVHGPLLVQLSRTKDGSEHVGWLVPAPHDALLLKPKSDSNAHQGTIRKQLVPLQFEQGKSDFYQHNEHNLLLVGQKEHKQGKPIEDAPAFWYWEQFEQWLLQPAALDGLPVDLERLGHRGLQRELRVHVAMDVEKHMGMDGALFDTSGIEFTSLAQHGYLNTAERLALVVAVEERAAFPMKAGLHTLGGERRIVSWRKSPAALPDCPSQLIETILQQKGVKNEVACRLVLLTPAYFKKGYYPEWIQQPSYGVNVTICAIAMQRPQVVSGWDMASKTPGAKPSRRLAPAGTVIYLSLAGSDDAIREWVDQMWMRPVSDVEDETAQEQKDGFGLAAIGSWSREPAAASSGKEQA
jgi:CRISPR-associated protein Cmr3